METQLDLDLDVVCAEELAYEAHYDDTFIKGIKKGYLNLRELMLVTTAEDYLSCALVKMQGQDLDKKSKEELLVIFSDIISFAEALKEDEDFDEKLFELHREIHTE